MFNPWQSLFPMMFNPNRNSVPLSFPPSQPFNSQTDQLMNFQQNFPAFPMFSAAQAFPNQSAFYNNPFVPPFVQPPIPTPEPPQPPPPPPAKTSEIWTQQKEQELQEAYAEEKDFDEQYTRWLSDFNDWKFQNKNHPNQDQYKKFAEEWQEYESQMKVRRESIKSHIAQLLVVKNSSNSMDASKSASITTNNQTQLNNTFNHLAYSTSFTNTTTNDSHMMFRPPINNNNDMMFMPPATTDYNSMTFKPSNTTTNNSMTFKPSNTTTNNSMAFKPTNTTTNNSMAFKPPTTTTSNNDMSFKTTTTTNSSSIMFRPPTTNFHSQFQNIQYRPPQPHDNKPLLPNPPHHVRYVPPSTVSSKPLQSYNPFQNKATFSNYSATYNSSKTVPSTAQNSSFLNKIANNFNINTNSNTNNALKNEFNKINNELKNNLADKKLSESIDQNIEKIKLQQSLKAFNTQKSTSNVTNNSSNNGSNSNFSSNQQAANVSQKSVNLLNVTTASSNLKTDTASSVNSETRYEDKPFRAPTYKEIFYNIKKSVDNTSQKSANKLQQPAKQDSTSSSQQFPPEVSRLKQLSETSCFPPRPGMQAPFRHPSAEPHQPFRHPRPFSSPGMHDGHQHDPFNRPPMPQSRSPFTPPMNFRQRGMSPHGNNPPFPDQRPPFSNQRPPFPNHRSPFPNHRPQFSEHRPPFSDHRPPFSDHRPPFSEQRPPFSEQKLPFSEQRPPFSEHRPRFSEQRPPFSTHARFGSLANRPPPPNARPPFSHQMMQNMPPQRPPATRPVPEEKVVPTKKSKWEPHEATSHEDKKKKTDEDKQKENKQFEGLENFKIRLVNHGSDKNFLSDKNENLPVVAFDIAKDKRNVTLVNKTINQKDINEKQKIENVKPHFAHDKDKSNTVKSRSSEQLVSKSNDTSTFDTVATFSEVGVIEGSKDVDYRATFGKHLSINSVPFQNTKNTDNTHDLPIHPTKTGTSNPSNFSRDQDFRIHTSWRPPVPNVGGTYNSSTMPKKLMGIEELLCKPGRSKRPANVVLLVRGLPGSGKSNLCQLIKEKEQEEGGSVPRILSLSHYYSLDDQQEEEGEDADITYKASLLKNFKKQVEEGFFSLIIVKAPFEDKGYIEQFWTFAKLKAFQVYVVELKTDLTTCVNNSRIKLDKLKKMHDSWQELPQHYIRINPSFLLDNIPDVEMDDAMTGRCKDGDGEEEDDDDLGAHKKSKWEMDTSEEQLEKLDGLKHMVKGVKMSLEEYLKDVAEEDDGKKKRVRWADVEEMRRKERGFMVGGRTEPVEFEQTRYF